MTEWATLDINSRVAIGRSKEIDIIQELANHDIFLNESLLISCSSSTDAEDQVDKIDAWLTTEDGKKYSAQIKYRDRGRDFGAAIIMPYINFARFCTQFDEKNIPWDRDARGVVDYYICMSDNDSILMVISKKTVLSIIAKSVAKLRFEGFGGNSFKHESLPGIELKIVKDRGAGYSQWQSKIIAYISPEYIKESGDYVRILK